MQSLFNDGKPHSNSEIKRRTRETDRMKAKIEAQNKAAVKLDQVDVSSFITSGDKK